MSSLVLLNERGMVARKLAFLSLPENFNVPEGMKISWKMEMEVPAGTQSVPPEAYICSDDAEAEIIRKPITPIREDLHLDDNELYPNDDLPYGPRLVSITIQGNTASEVTNLRKQILQMINSGMSWGFLPDISKLEFEGVEGVSS